LGQRRQRRSVDRTAGPANVRRGIAAVAVLAACAGCEARDERIASLESQIAKLEERVEQDAAARELLDGVEVVEAAFDGRVEGRAGTARFELTVRNHTEQLLDRVQFEAVLSSADGRELLRGRIDGRVPGTVDPGKSLAYQLYPLEGSPWDRLAPPPDAVLELTPVRLSSVGNRNLAAARSTERQAADEASLARLRDELAELDPSRR